MFDLISGGPRHPFHEPTAAPVLVSIVGHVAVVTVLVVLPLMYAANRLPVVPTMMAFVASPPAPPPPPPPPPPPAARGPERKSTPAKTVPPRQGELVAPLEAPSEVLPEPAGFGDEEEEGGVEGGVIGGVAGGIVGGLIATPPPPPPPPPPQAPPSRAPVRVGGDIQPPALLKRVEPVYPDLALMAQVKGLVILEAVVGADGAVESVKVLRSVRFLDKAAIDAVKQWKHAPLVLNGIPTPFMLTVTLNFRAE